MKLKEVDLTRPHYVITINTEPIISWQQKQNTPH